MVKKIRVLSIRASAADDAALGRLARQIGLDRSKVVRSLIRIGARLLREKKLSELDFRGDD